MIKSLREISGMNQADFAKSLGVRQATISDWERGKLKPSRLAQLSMSLIQARAKLDKAIAFHRNNTNDPHNIGNAVICALTEVREALSWGTQ